MNKKIAEAFAHGKAFIPFVTCGDPSLEVTEQLVYAMEEAGADLIELGIPFSDPTAEGPVIQAANVRALSGGVTTDKIFDMVDAVAAHQQKKALDLYYDLLALKEAPMRILYLITNQFQRLMVVKAMTNQGFSNRDIAPKAGCPEWAVKKYQAQCRAFHMEQLKKAIADGVEYETAVKTGRMNDQMAVELFIVTYSKQSKK